jgi:general secretion pathway protein C
MMTSSLPSPARRWAIRGTSFTVWALAAGSAVFWGLRLSQPAVPPAVEVAGQAAVAADPALLARFLGAPNGQAPAVAGGAALAGRFSLVGVVADGHRWGAALIAIDGKPARPYRVGAQLEDGVTLLSVEQRRAVLGPSPEAPPSLTLDLPAPKP